MLIASDHERLGCDRCRFWDGQDPTPGDEVAYGLCRRFPPGENGWPGTSPDDWCGEFVVGGAKLGEGA